MKEIQGWLGHSSIPATANSDVYLDTASKSLSAVKLNSALPIQPGIQTNLRKPPHILAGRREPA
ncbi:MAG: recombinase [Oscillibacter sp.]|jgi:hypothetical protein|nr:recombinase [Oscillibacter sp.]